MTNPGELAAVELVVAVSENDVIGRANQLPWRLSADLRHFKNLTMGHDIFMGRKTYQSIGRALPGRINWVLSRSGDFAPADCKVVRSLQESRSGAGEGPLMVIGGAEIYRLCLPQAQRIHLTLVHTHITDGDTFFSAWHDAGWVESGRERHEPDEKNAYAYSFMTLERVGSSAAAQAV
jgi:dihydrofolate reductase